MIYIAAAAADVTATCAAALRPCDYLQRLRRIREHLPLEWPPATGGVWYLLPGLDAPCTQRPP